MDGSSRRRFLTDLGRGMIVASIGASVASDLGLAPLFAADESAAPQPDSLQPLVQFLHEAPPDKMLGAVVAKLKAGLPLPTLVAAAALANAQAFGGEDYVGFHTLMALAPALSLSKVVRAGESFLPVLKVLYRNSARLQEVGGASAVALGTVPPVELPAGADPASFLRQQVHEGNRERAEGVLIAACNRSPEQALNDLLVTVEEGTEVHRVVLVHRAWDMVPLVGTEQAHAMLRQSLRYCVRNEPSGVTAFAGVRALLPKLIDQYKLAGRTPGERTMSDGELSAFVEALFTSTPDQAAEVAAAALADGFSPTALAEAVSLAANQLVLRDAGRMGQQVQPGKTEGSVHGDSIGVHACDSANAWRNIANYGDRRHKLAATILGAYQVALDRGNRGGDFANWKPRPTEELLRRVTSDDKSRLLAEIDAAIRGNNQELACAVAHHYLEKRLAPGDMFGLFAGYATSEDGALHAEKFFRTVEEEFRLTRPPFRNRHLVALARVTASEFGKPAPGVAEARELLGLN